MRPSNYICGSRLVCDLYLNTTSHEDFSEPFSYEPNNLLFVSNNIELSYIKDYLIFKNKNIETILKHDEELLLFIYDCLKILVNQKLYWVGELDLLEEDESGYENRFLFIYRTKKIREDNYVIDYSSKKNNKDLYDFFLRSLFKKSKKLRKTFIIDERVL